MAIRGIYSNWLKPMYRYIGYRTDGDVIGTKSLCFGFWWFHVYAETNEHI